MERHWFKHKTGGAHVQRRRERVDFLDELEQRLDRALRCKDRLLVLELGAQHGLHFKLLSIFR